MRIFPLPSLVMPSLFTFSLSMPSLLTSTLLMFSLLLPGAAHAHAILIDSQPAARGVAAPGTEHIVLRFNSRVDHGRSRLALRTGGAEQVLHVAPSGADDVLETQAELTPGDYVLRWQVLAVDGHITRGDVPFQVKAP